MSLYQLHSNPESLYKYSEAPYRIPGMAYELAAKKYRRTGQRDPELERVIAQDPWSAYRYAAYVIKDRWPEAEPVIAQDLYSAYWYARDVIGDRWPEAEPYIKQDPDWWDEYKEYFNILYR